MPLLGLVSGSILTSSSSKTPDMVRLSQAIELGLYQWLLTSQVVANGVGVIGSGQCAGQILIAPQPPLMEGAFKANGLLGAFASMMWLPVVLGISKPYVFTGVSPLVGSGVVGGGLFVGDPVLLAGFLGSSFSSVGMVGVNIPLLSSALSQGIYAHFQLGQVLGNIVGVGGTSPSTSQVIGKFI